MFYCPGRFCSKKDICLHHHLKNSMRCLQLIDMSIHGSVGESIDRAGTCISQYEPHCGDRASKYYSLWECKTWQDKGDFENYNNPAHAEGWAVAPGTLIKILNEQGEEEIIPFDPKTLRLDTKVVSWH